MPEREHYLTVKAAAYLGVCRNTLRNWDRNGKIPVHRHPTNGYPSQKPEVCPQLAGLIVGLDAEGDPDGARFEACAKRVTEALKGQPWEFPVEVRVSPAACGRGLKLMVWGGYPVWAGA